MKPHRKLRFKLVINADTGKKNYHKKIKFWTKICWKFIASKSSFKDILVKLSWYIFSLLNVWNCFNCFKRQQKWNCSAIYELFYQQNYNVDTTWYVLDLSMSCRCGNVLVAQDLPHVVDNCSLWPSGLLSIRFFRFDKTS